KLERLGYFTSAGDGSPKGRNQTAIRTFLCGSSYETQTIFVSKDDPQIDLDSTESTLDSFGAYEGGAIPPETLDTLEWAEDALGADELGGLEVEHGADELNVLEVEPIPIALAPAQGVNWALVAELEAKDDEAFAAWFASHAPAQPAEAPPRTSSSAPV